MGDGLLAEERMGKGFPLWCGADRREVEGRTSETQQQLAYVGARITALL
jgi:hypothetical protein